MEDDTSTLRILVATDCHLGYMEKDEIRRHDSFYAFEEICSIAEQKQVDFVLLGGDLFHENKPSRTTLVKTIEILRRYCLNDRPVQFQVVSDQTINFANVFGHVNYEDPNFNVGLPVFTIHGNHDDPAGVDNLSAIDILSACNLVNYFGKMVLGGSGVGQITLYPILIRKDVTSVALYGLGNIRDERLNRMFQTPHAVQWMRPEPQEGCPMSDWFNILVLHQNRVKTNPKNAINEQFLPRFLDFVIWGHEHECLVDPQEVSGMGFHLTQPGSSVATSLIDGEAKPKHVLLLEIKGSQYRPTKIALQSVRPFEFKEVVLRDDPDLDPNDQTAVLEYLDKLVRDMIVHAEGRVVSRPDLKIPLVRIKVDYTCFTTINPQRFGQKFVGKVANPHDILLFSKSTKRQQSVDEKIQDAERLRPEELNQQNIEALVAESNLKMEILPVNDLDVALHEFVNKDDKMAFSSCVQQNLKETRNKLVQEAEVLQIKEEEDVILKVGQCMQEREKERALHPKTGFSGGLGSQPSQVTKAKNSSQLASQNAFSDEEDEPVKVTKSKTVVWGQKTKSSQISTIATDVADSRGRGTRGRGRGRGSRGLKQTAGCNIEEIKELRVDEDERHGSFTEIVPMNQVLLQKFGNLSSQQGADGAENARISNSSHVNHFSIRGGCIFSVGGVDSDTMQAGDKKLAGIEGSFGSSLTQDSVLYVDQVNIEQVNETAVTFEDKKQKCHLESYQEQIKPAKTCEGEEKKCFSVFRIVSSSFEEENVSYNLFKSIDSLEVIFDASSGNPDLERLVLTFESLTNLTKEEMVSICVSALVSKFAFLMANSKARRLCDPDPTSFLWSKNLMDQINKVSSNNATKGAFSKVFVLDILVSLMTKFLIEGEVMVYTASAEYNGTLMEAEHGQFSVLRHIATIAELEAGSHVLASFCLALGNMNCLYEVMYMVLRWCKKDSIWLLTVVHSITFLCWKHCLQVSRSNVLGNTICAIILLLEGHEKGVPQSLLNHSDIVSVQKQTHPLSMRCPFAEDVLSMDGNISFLLETLKHYPVSNKKGEQTPIKVLDCEKSAFIYNVERKVESQKMNYCQQDGSAALNNLQDVSEHRDHFQNKKEDASCYLSVLNDTVLALELVAQYLGWDWTYNELIPHFWRMAQPNAPDVLIMTIFLLVGIIGRFGIDYDGFEQRGVEELRRNLSTLLDLHCVTKGRHIFSFSCQLAAAQSLFELMSGNTKRPRANQIEPAQRIVGREAIHSTHLNILKKWYSNLNAEQQSMLPEYMRADISPLTN